MAAAQDYARVLKYLQGLPIVREVHVEEAAANRLQLTLGLRTGVEGLKRLAQGGGVLVPPADAAEPLVFRLRH